MIQELYSYVRRGNAEPLDPRIYQISVLGSLLLYGVGWLNFEVAPLQILTIIGCALLTQYICTLAWDLLTFDPKSALISGLSLCLLLRTSDLSIALMAAFLAISSKFVLRWNKRHLFNPTNVSLLLVMIAGFGWVSPGQWGREVLFILFIACLGGLVVNRSSRSDVTYAFLTIYVTLLMGRALWLGDPLVIPLHQLQNGALLIFAFYMISDPKTTPDSRAGRLLYAACIASLALFIQYGLYQPNGLLWALVCSAPIVPVLNWMLPGAPYTWTSPHPDTHLPVTTSPMALPTYAGSSLRQPVPHVSSDQQLSSQLQLVPYKQ